MRLLLQWRLLTATMFYEVQIPVGGGTATRTFQVDASNWRAAFRASVTSLDGSETPDERGLFASLGADRVVITDAARRRVVRVRRVRETDVRQSQVLRAASGVHERPAEPGTKPPVVTGPMQVKDLGTGKLRTVRSTEIRASGAMDPGSGRIVAETVEPAGAAVGPEAEDSADGRVDSVSETALEDVFMEIMTLFEPDFAMEDAIDFVLDLAIRHVPSGVGGLLFASDEADHLYFAATRGENRKALSSARLSIRDGLPASALRDGVAIAMSSGTSDRRHTAELAEAGGFAVESLCVAPIQSGARGYGVLLLANRGDRTFYSQYDANIATYIGAQMGRYIQERLDEVD